MPRQTRSTTRTTTRAKSSRATTKTTGSVKRKVTRALTKKAAVVEQPDREAAPTTRMTLVLYEDQLRWLRRKAFDARDQGQRGVDMSSIVRDLLDASIRGR